MFLRSRTARNLARAAMHLRGRCEPTAWVGCGESQVVAASCSTCRTLTGRNAAQARTTVFAWPERIVPSVHVPTIRSVADTELPMPDDDDSNCLPNQPLGPNKRRLGRTTGVSPSRDSRKLEPNVSCKWQPPRGMAQQPTLGVAGSRR